MYRLLFTIALTAIFWQNSFSQYAYLDSSFQLMYQDSFLADLSAYQDSMKWKAGLLHKGGEGEICFFTETYRLDEKLQTWPSRSYFCWKAGEGVQLKQKQYLINDSSLVLEDNQGLKQELQFKEELLPQKTKFASFPNASMLLYREVLNRGAFNNSMNYSHIGLVDNPSFSYKGNLFELRNGMLYADKHPFFSKTEDIYIREAFASPSYLVCVYSGAFGQIVLNSFSDKASLSFSIDAQHVQLSRDESSLFFLRRTKQTVGSAKHPIFQIMLLDIASSELKSAKKCLDALQLDAYPR